MQRVVILGGGISGLATALHLQDGAEAAGTELEVVVLEAGSRVGGNIRTDRVDGFTIETGPNGWLDSVAETGELVARLGLDDERQPADAAAGKRFLYRHGRLHELAPSPVGFLRSGVLSRRGRLRVMLEPFAKRRPEGKEETVFEFARRRIGAEAASVLVDAMVSGVFAGNVHELSLESTFPKMAAMEAEHGGLVRAMVAKMRQRRRDRREGRDVSAGGPAGPAGTLTSFRDGLDVLPSTLATVLGNSVRLSSRVTAIAPRSRGAARWQIETEEGEALSADALVLALPSPRAVPLLETFDPELAATVGRIPTAGLAVVALAYKAETMGEAPDGFGFLVPRGEGPRILGCLWDSSIFPGRAPEGGVLLRAMIGGAHDPRAVELGDDDLVEVVRGDLAATMGLQAEPLWTRIYRHPLGIGQYLVGHQSLLDRIHARLKSLPGLWVAGSSYYGVSMNACFERAPCQAEEILALLVERETA